VGAWRRDFKTFFVDNVIVASATPFYQTRHIWITLMNSSIMKKVLSSDCQQSHQYNQNKQSHITSTHCTTYDVRIPYPGLG
jgi:hypothetical protein